METILIIEDNLDVRENIIEILELAGYTVLSAENGKQGIRIAKKETPDLIICDIMMPEADGYTVLHSLGKVPETAGIPFIFLSAKSEMDDVRKGMNLGADDYLTKPFREMELLDAVDTRLKRSKVFKSDFKKDAGGLNEFMDEARGLKELESLIIDQKTQRYRAKEVVFHKGQYPYYLYFVAKGKIKTTKMVDSGKTLVTNLYQKGDFFGYIPLLDGTTYMETATVIEDAELELIPKDSFNALIQKNRDVSYKFIKMLTNNVLEKEERLLMTAYATVRERVASTLLQIEDNLTSSQDGFTRINMLRDDLAGVVGTSTESLIRTLADFKEEGLIEVNGREIKILERKKLEWIYPDWKQQLQPD